jgi:hypothetical protein
MYRLELLSALGLKSGVISPAVCLPLLFHGCSQYTLDPGMGEEEKRGKMWLHHADLSGGVSHESALDVLSAAGAGGGMDLLFLTRIIRGREVPLSPSRHKSGTQACCSDHHDYQPHCTSNHPCRESLTCDRNGGTFTLTLHPNAYYYSAPTNSNKLCSPIAKIQAVVHLLVTEFAG